MPTVRGDARDRRGIVIGTAGHVDHGKTALVRALTGVETDRWVEERKRGLTIDLGFARLDLDPDLETGIVDVPGHEDFLKNMLAGATGIDVLLLVVAADEGPMPQTHEHLAIARLLNIRRGVVALTKSDRVDGDWLDLASETTRELLDEDPARASWEIVPVSAVTGDGIAPLRASLRRLAAGIRARSIDDRFRLPVDRSFSIRGTGTVVTGTVWSGSVSVGDTVRVFPDGGSARVRALQVHEDPRRRVTAGRRCAVALVGVAPAGVERGSVLVDPSEWRSSERLGVRVRALGSRDRPLRHGQRLRVYLGTREVMARLQTAGRQPVAPGATAWAVLALEAPLLARTRDRAILRFYSPVTTIGGIRVAEPDPPPDWPARTAAWRRILDGAPAEALAAAVTLEGLRGLPVATSSIILGRRDPTLEAAAEEAECVRIGDRWFAADAVAEAMEAVEACMARLHAADRRAPGVSKEAVRSAMVRVCDLELAETAVGRLLADGRLLESGPRLALPGHAPRLTPREEEGRAQLAETIAAAGLQPPLVAELGKKLRLDRAVLDDLLRLLQEAGATKAVTPELHVAVGALEKVEARARELLADGVPAPPARFKEAFGLSRKYLIPLLEYLDREGVTRRTVEGRVLARPPG
ncbi:MAG: selenocysteine-specific translation elongation factor [Gemmatimonadales bacterium]|nr:selenocysteine-specific translation elongation factor [Gemmatimonadales bacterium]MYG49867.1 selenocysteine-specific translation elongation factor [Gemmatimonadales bacterium]MYK03007.1 selenocysteine-specific translation elongation factor [Candidatus Palauibacter ramosifaciens]